MAIRAGAVLVLLALLGWGILAVWQQYRANLLYVPVQTQINHWADGASVPTKAQWQQTLEAIDEATQLQPRMADYQLTKAKVLEWGWYLQFAEPSQVSQLPSLYQAAQHLRPRWAQAYADEAWYWYFIGQQESKSLAALQTAYQLGPFVPEVLFRGLTVQLQRWPQLSLVDRAELFKQLKWLFATDLRQRLIRLVKANQREKVACLFLRQQQDLPRALLREVNTQFCEVQR